MTILLSDEDFTRIKKAMIIKIEDINLQSFRFSKETFIKASKIVYKGKFGEVILRDRVDYNSGIVSKIYRLKDFL